MQFGCPGIVSSIFSSIFKVPFPLLLNGITLSLGESLTKQGTYGPQRLRIVSPWVAPHKSISNIEGATSWKSIKYKNHTTFDMHPTIHPKHAKKIHGFQLKSHCVWMNVPNLVASHPIVNAFNPILWSGVLCDVWILVVTSGVKMKQLDVDVSSPACLMSLN